MKFSMKKVFNLAASSAGAKHSACTLKHKDTEMEVLYVWTFLFITHFGYIHVHKKG